MANEDNLLLAAGASGFFQGLSSTLVPLWQEKIKSDREYQHKLELYKQEREAQKIDVPNLQGETGETFKREGILPGSKLDARLVPYLLQKKIDTGETVFKKSELLKMTLEQRSKLPKHSVIDDTKSIMNDLSPAQQNASFKLSDDYEKASGDFPKMKDFYNRVSASAKDPSAAGDLALIFNYMKLLDPTSVVREGEFATAQNSGSVPSRIQAQYNKVLHGERLNDTIRNDFVDRSKRIYKSSFEQQKRVDSQFSDRAKKFGIDPSLVIRDQSAVSDVEPPKISNPSLNGQATGNADDILREFKLLK